MTVASVSFDPRFHLWSWSKLDDGAEPGIRSEVGGNRGCAFVLPHEAGNRSRICWIRARRRTANPHRSSNSPPKWRCVSPNQAMQLHGGNGYTTEQRIDRYWREARPTTIFEGASEIQRRIISDRMLPRT